jgi:hypothetical protein
MNIQSLFDDCIALEKQRHFAQRIAVDFSFDLRSEDQTRFGPGFNPRDFDLSIVKGQGSFTYTGQRAIRIHPQPEQVLGQLVVIPGNLVATVPCSFDITAQGIGGADFVQDFRITIAGPVGGSNATIDVDGTVSGLAYPFVFEVDPNTAIPLKATGLIPVHTKNTLVIALSPPALISTLPIGPRDPKGIVSADFP